MRRRLFAVASIASLLACLATLVLWVRSYWRADCWVFGETNTSAACIFSGWGTFGDEHIYGVHGQRMRFAEKNGYFSEPVNRPSPTVDDFLKDGAVYFHSFMGFKAYRRWIGEGYESEVSAPMWLMASSLAIFAVLFWVVSHNGRVLRDQCPACGYNLTGNTSGVCPECGTPVPPKHKVTA